MTVDYQSGDVDFTADDAESWKQDPAEKLGLTGRCPRCDELSTHVVQLDFTSIASADTPTAEEIDTTQSCRCKCTKTHPKAPEGADGCGARWEMTVVGKPGDLKVRHEESETRRKQARRIFDAAEAAEQGVGVVAEKWLPGVAALTGIFSISAAVVSGGSAGKLSAAVSIIAFALLVLAIVGATSALVMGYRAAYGWPKVRPISTPEEQEIAYTEIGQRMRNARRQLKWAVGLAGTAIVSLLISLGLVWFKPGSASPPTTVRVAYHPAGAVSATTERCGELLGSDDQGRLRLSFPAGGSEILTIPMDWVQRIEPAACDGI
jgi:hypothetical protein